MTMPRAPQQRHIGHTGPALLLRPLVLARARARALARLWVTLLAAAALARATASETTSTAPAPRLGGSAAGIYTWSDLLKHTNSHRARHGAPALTWSASLAASAVSWAQRCTFQHSKTAGAYGENLAMGFQNWRAAVDAWYYEARPAPPPCQRDPAPPSVRSLRRRRHRGKTSTAFALATDAAGEALQLQRAELGACDGPFHPVGVAWQPRDGLCIFLPHLCLPVQASRQRDRLVCCQCWAEALSAARAQACSQWRVAPNRLPTLAPGMHACPS